MEDCIRCMRSLRDSLASPIIAKLAFPRTFHRSKNHTTLKRKIVDGKNPRKKTTKRLEEISRDEPIDVWRTEKKHKDFNNNKETETRRRM